jgi:hypothetical protein
MASSGVKNRSEILTLLTPRGLVQVAHQQWRSHRAKSRWEEVWVARRRGQLDWRQSPSAREAIGQALLLAAGKHPAWLLEVADRAQRELGRVRAAQDARDRGGADAS